MTKKILAVKTTDNKTLKYIKNCLRIKFIADVCNIQCNTMVLTLISLTFLRLNSTLAIIFVFNFLDKVVEKKIYQRHSNYCLWSQECRATLVAPRNVWLVSRPEIGKLYAIFWHQHPISRPQVASAM